MEVSPYSYFWWWEYFQGPWVSFVTTDEFSVRVTKITSRTDASWTASTYLFDFNLFLTQWIMAKLSKRCKSDNFESSNSLKLSFTNIRVLCSNFVECELFLESNSNEILALRETNFDDWIDSGNFSVMDYLPLIRKDYITYMHGLVVYVKEGPPFARDVSLKNSADSYLCLRLALLHSVSYFFFLYWSSSLSLCTVLDSISSNIDEVLLIDPSANVFVF